MKCRFCDKTITAESITRMKYHWVGERTDVSACEKVPAEVKRDAMEDSEEWETKKKNKGVTCDFCGTTNYKAGEKRRGVRPCKKIGPDARKAALEDIQKSKVAKGKRPHSNLSSEERQSSQLTPSAFPAEVFDVSAEQSDPAVRGLSLGNRTYLGTSHQFPSSTAYDHQYSQLYPSGPAHDHQYPHPYSNNEAASSAVLPLTFAETPPPSAHSNLLLPNSLAGSHRFVQLCSNNESTQSGVGSLPIVPGNETYGQNTQADLAEQVGIVPLHLPSTQSAVTANAQGLVPLNPPSCLPGYNSAREAPSGHTPDSSARDDEEVDASTQRKNDTVVSKIKYAVPQQFFLTGLPSSHLSTGEFCQFADAITILGSSYRYVLQLIASSNKDVADFSIKLKHEVDDYVKKVKHSWTSTKCTICIKDFMVPNDNVHIFAAIARSQRGTVFLKYETVSLPKKCQSRAREIKYKRLLRSVLDDIGLNKISHIMIPCNMPFLYGNYQTITLVDVADHLAKAYIDIYHEVSGLVFLEYAYFTASVFDNLPTMMASHGHLSLLSAMLERKQEIRSLQTEVNPDFVNGLKFWNSDEDYNIVCERIGSMLQVAKREDFIFPKHSIVLEQEEKRKNVCKRIVEIITGNDILPNSTFWRSVEAYMHLYNHIHKMLEDVGNDNCTFADYLLAYTKARRKILKDDFLDSDYTKILKGVDNLIPKEESGQTVACYLCPRIRCLKPDVYKIEHAESELKKMVEGDESRKKSLFGQLRVYDKKDNAYIEGEAWLPPQMVIHSKVWWENWGSRVPDLQALAINILDGPCSNSRNWKIMYDMYTSMSEKCQAQKLHALLYVKLNNYFKHNTARYQDEGLALVGSKKIGEVTDLNNIFCNKYFTNDVY